MEIARDLEQRRTSIQNLESELDKIRITNAQLVKKIAEQTELLKATETKAVQLTSTLKETDNQLVGAKDELHRSQTALQNLKTENKAMASLGKQKEAIEKVVSELKNENALLQEKIRTAEQKNKKSAELELTLDKKIIELTEGKERIDILENKRDDLQSELDIRKAEFTSMEEKYTSLQNRLNALQKERDALFPYTLDSDNDTISDAQDKCPETVHGAEINQEGCELDSDNDGLFDRLDLCPEAPGQTDINIFGCTKGEHIVLSDIFFSDGNAQLSPASQSYLNKVAGVLKLFTDIHFEVVGHTDSIGESARNLTVSKLRAGAVTDYLVAKGIESRRLVPLGLGSEQPIADNTTLAGRAANRRVELKIIPPNDTSVTAEEEKPTAAAEEEGSQAQ